MGKQIYSCNPLRKNTRAIVAARRTIGVIYGECRFVDTYNALPFSVSRTASPTNTGKGKYNMTTTSSSLV